MFESFPRFANLEIMQLGSKSGANVATVAFSGKVNLNVFELKVLFPEGPSLVFTF